MKQQFLSVHPNDNVLVALQNLNKGQIIEFDDKKITLKEPIPSKHKFAIESLPENASITMYGVLVGKSTVNINAGQRISTENTIHDTQAYTAKNQKIIWESPDVSKWKSKTFNGYHRSDGQVGTQNIWLVIPLVFCENRNVKKIEDALQEILGYAPKKDSFLDTESIIKAYQSGATAEEILSFDIVRPPEVSSSNKVFPNIDGIKFLTHDGGCGGTREDADLLCSLLAGYINHPNVAGATVLSLGCQHAQSSMLREKLNEKNPSFSKPLYFFEQQESKSEPDFISQIVKQTFVGLIEANKSMREPASLSHLKLGLECGGSDGFSGISANPALGYTSDLLVALGGTCILAEFPELNGVEQELINRCVRQSVAEKFSELMKEYSNRAIAVGSGFESNPSPGNIKDGLITDAMKSAGAAKKGGTSPVQAVLNYAESATVPGLNLLCTPGNDVESTTGLAGSGANLIVFTTGLGTPTGNPVSPVVKMSTNTQLYNRMKDIIDFDAGSIIQGEDSIETKGEELFDYLIQVASGEETPHAVRLGQDDFIPWKRGISL